MAFQCTIVTPEHQVLDESVRQAIVPAHDGLIGILTDRAPCWRSSGWASWRSTWPPAAGGYS